ncbi:hypothetical protein Tco_0547287, partial [Tanacetum coccineum]
CRGLSLISSPLQAMKSQSQIQSSAAVKFGGVTKLQFVEEPVEIMDREVKWLMQSRIPLVKV